jgi:hypothetical protein
MVWARFVLAGLCAVTLAASAEAAGGGGGHASEGPSNRVVANFTLQNDVETAPTEGLGDPGVAGPRVVDIPVVTLPAFTEDEELRGYFFVSVRLIVAEGVDAWRIREKAHIVRDAMIRAGHRHAIASSARTSDIDIEHARAILREAVGEVVPPAQIERLEILNVDAPAH